VQKLVEQKSRLDALAADGQLAGLLPPEWQGHGVRAIELSTFIQGVLPFLQPANVAKPRPRACQCATCWGRQPLGPGRCPNRSRWPGTWPATSAPPPAARTWPRPIWWGTGLAWMQEGRSRPGFLRAMGQDSLAARVTMLGYPPANELALYSVTAHGQPQIWCVHGRRRMRPLVAPWLSVPLLTAYGVPAPVAWPSSFPPVEAVAELLATARQGRALPEVDLAKAWRRSPRTPPRRLAAGQPAAAQHLVTALALLPGHLRRPAVVLLVAARARCRGRSKRPRLPHRWASPAAPSLRWPCRGSTHGASIC
jgi:hypothetical protein